MGIGNGNPTNMDAKIMGLNGPPKKMMEIQPCFMEVISMKFRSWRITHLIHVGKLGPVLMLTILGGNVRPLVTSPSHPPLT